MTAWVTTSPRRNSASSLSFRRIIAEISTGENSLPPMTTCTLSLVPEEGSTTLYKLPFRILWTSGSAKPRPMRRLMEMIVSSGAYGQLS